MVAHDLVKGFGTVRALDGVSLRVGPGCTALLGENGAGKSTLIKLLLGLLQPDAGRAIVLGHDVVQEGVAVRSRVGYFPEHDCLPLDWQAQDFVRHIGAVRGLPPRVAVQRASDVLAQVGLAEERYRQIGGFSTGMKQRVKLAQALVHDPSLVLLDEPTNGLDPLGRDEMLALIGRVVHEMGINALVSSHLLADVQAICDAAVILRDGRVLAQGAMAELLTDTDILAVQLLSPAPAFVDALRRLGCELLDVTGDGAGLTIRLTDESVFDRVRDAAVESGAGITLLKRRSRSLEDVFLAGGPAGATLAEASRLAGIADESAVSAAS